jgi:AcrR family transcriptional regulator
MPRVVDGDERRAELIAATSAEIATRGLANVTLRSVARARGWTTGIVTHYFTDKRELLMATFRDRADRARRYIEEQVTNGVRPLDAAIDAALPVDDERMLDWRVFLAYMGASIGEEELDALLRDRQERFRDTLRAGIVDEIAAGRLPARVDPDHAVTGLLATLNGVATLAVLAPDRWPPALQRAVVADQLASLGRTRV